jgi:hypothetical protein
MTERIRTSENALTAGAGPAGGRPAPSTAPRTPSGVYLPSPSAIARAVVRPTDPYTPNPRG